MYQLPSDTIFTSFSYYSVSFWENEGFVAQKSTTTQFSHPTEECLNNWDDNQITCVTFHNSVPIRAPSHWRRSRTSRTYITAPLREKTDANLRRVTPQGSSGKQSEQTMRWTSTNKPLRAPESASVQHRTGVISPNGLLSTTAFCSGTLCTL